MRLVYPPELPVSARRADIAAAIADHQVVVVAGETGSGKTTQLPKICLELGRGRPDLPGGAMIGHTQPRRIAARAVAERVAEELGTQLGDLVGYQVRFTDKTSTASRVKLMTDGILLAELPRDKLLRRYDTIILDEAHERSLNVDFLVGYLTRLLPRRPDLKLVVTSATIDPGRFAEHFADRRGRPAPVIEVSGRTYPVEVRYRPLVETPETDEEGETVVRDQTEAIVAALRELSAEGPGDVLVFLPGEREIRDTADVLAGALPGLAGRGRSLEVVPLYSRLSAAEQHRVFERHDPAARRVVLATNVAETSLTVPGIRYVVDTGVARISRYSARTKVQRLPLEPISRASADQRSGRCGRVEAGVAIRLYSEEDLGARPAFTDPEILRTNLASVILQMAALDLGEVTRFPFLDPPDRRAVAAGRQLLEELGALSRAAPGDARGARLTPTGRRLARLPVDPRLGRMILEAERRSCVREVVVVVAALSVQDPRERPAEQRTQADQLHARFTDQSSDFVSWLSLWRYLREQQHELSSSAFRRLCRREHLNYLRVREWQDLESQLRQICREMNVDLGPRTAATGGSGDLDADSLHQSLLAGLLSHVGALEERERTGGRRGPREYLGARGTRFAIFPGSALKGRNPAYLMAGELVETSRLWARQNAAIRPEWAEQLGSHLVHRSWSEPHWSRKRAAAMAYEKVTLYGVPLVTDRLVTYGPVDPETSRELFIRHALVQGEWHTRHRFYEHNRRLLKDAEELEHRARRRDLVVDEQTLFELYDARVGADVVSGAHFDQWWKRERKRRPDLLTFDPAMLVHDTAGDVRDEDYPTVWSLGAEDGGLTLPISYAFEPGAADDGLTIEVPVATLNRVEADDFSWQVPGLRQELVTALVRSLPKHLRVHLVPAPNRAREFLAAVPPGDEPLLDALERHIRSTTGVVVPRDAWDWDKVPEHLRPTFRVVDESGRENAIGKDLDALKAPLRARFAAAVAQAAAESGRSATGRTTWDFGPVEESNVAHRAGQQVLGYPAVVDEGATVGVRAFGTRAEAAAWHRAGVVRLLRLELAGPGADRALVDGLDTAARLAVAGAPYPSAAALVEDCRAAVLADAVDARAPVRDREAYDLLRQAVEPDLVEGTRAALADALRVLRAWRQADRALSGRADLALLPSLTDMRGQVGRLVAPGFVGEAGARRLRHLPRYLTAVERRRERLDASVTRDRELLARFAPLEEAFLHRMAALQQGAPAPEDLRTVRWLLEELRVSLWAQELGTAVPVSEQRVRRALG